MTMTVKCSLFCLQVFTSKSFIVDKNNGFKRGFLVLLLILCHSYLTCCDGHYLFWYWPLRYLLRRENQWNKIPGRQKSTCIYWPLWCRSVRWVLNIFSSKTTLSQCIDTKFVMCVHNVCTVSCMSFFSTLCIIYDLY